MAKVKCAFCGKVLDRDTEAYIVKGNKRNKYYCNAEHSISIKPRDLMYQELFDILGREITSSILFKEFDEIGKIHGFEKICAYIKENKYYLRKVMSRNFDTVYGEVRYLAAIFKNNLNEFVPPEEEVVIKNDEIEFYDQKVTNKKNKRRGIDAVLNDITNK